MLQRIQTIYLALAAIFAGSTLFVFDLSKTIDGVVAFDKQHVLLGFIASAVLSLVSIFMFKNRKLQFVLNRLNIILNFILLAVFVYGSLNAPGEANASEKGVGILPIISIVLLVLSNKAIKKDEDLVKSVDRLR
jgi:Na+/proline symporter|tara:strand:- start:611 stop:1012 length:402 start_codon:yes stop_codon:yes gene_type:complete